MQLRFLAAAGPREPLERLSGRLAVTPGPALQPILREPELGVWTVPGTPHVAAADGSAVAVGLLFDRTDDRAIRELPRPLPPAEEFLARHWGAYALLSVYPGSGHAVLRDPSGAVTVYHRRCGGLDFYASDAALLAAGSAERLAPEIAFLRQWLTFPALRAEPTGVRGVRELLPGSLCRRAEGEVQVSLPWSPWEHARPDRAIDEAEAAAALLRESILRTVPRLAAPAGEVVIELSGGLDSSIVATALAQAGRRFAAVTFATQAADGDERIYAREVARRCGIALAELVEVPAAPDFGEVPPLALRPRPSALLQPLQAALAAHLARTGADLALDGAGGDNAFCYLASASPALDALRRRSLGAGLAALQDVAQLHGTTVWAAAGAAFRRARRPRSAWPRDESFLAPGAAPLHPPEHPWLAGAEAAEHGSAEHVRSIVGIRHFLADPAPGSVATLHPLLAQPVLEACLRIPSWLWVRGGRDRAVARAAFRDLLPPLILARRSKGHLGSLFTSGYMAGRRQLEDLLLGGRMAQAGLLDTGAIRAYLHREEPPGDPGYIRLLDLSAAEAWLRSFDP